MLRAGIIVPFQFRDTKKLLMIGEPGENRNLNIWDLKNVVRSAFGIYNFEFRNQKIGFNIPEELLVQYLAQRHDLTNFVIEIGLAPSNDDIVKHEEVSYEPSGALNTTGAVPQESKDCTEDAAQQEFNFCTSMMNKRATTLNNLSAENIHEIQKKARLAQAYTENTPESIQSIDTMIVPKSEQDELDIVAQDSQTKTQLLQQLRQYQHQQQQATLFPPNYSNYRLDSNQTTTQSQVQQQPQQHQHQLNRFRRRGERMCKDQKEIYVKYFEENTCMLAQRRNDTVLEPHWNKLAGMLNVVPQGAVKNVEEWKQTFDAWRYRVFMYTRHNSKLTGLAAQNSKNYKPITATDNRAYAMWTSHKSAATNDFDKIEMYAHLEVNQPDYIH